MEKQKNLTALKQKKITWQQHTRAKNSTVPIIIHRVEKYQQLILVPFLISLYLCIILKYFESNLCIYTTVKTPDISALREK